MFPELMSFKRERTKLIEKKIKEKANIVLLLSPGENVPIDFSSKYSYRIIGDPKENTSFIQYLGNSVDSLVLEKDSVDALVLGQILSKIEDPRALIEKIYQALKEEGLLLAAFPNKKKVDPGNYKSLFDKYRKK